MISYEKCKCGHPSCRDYWLVGIGSFCQGSGFTLEEAKRIVDALNFKLIEEAPRKTTAATVRS